MSNSDGVSEAIGRRCWAVADGYLPSWSHGPEPELLSHDALCLLNTTSQEAHVEIMVYFSERPPAGPYRFEVPAQRTKHIRFNNFTDPEVIPLATDYSSVIRSDIPIVVQHTRLDSRQAENAVFSTIAYPASL